MAMLRCYRKRLRNYVITTWSISSCPAAADNANLFNWIVYVFLFRTHKAKYLNFCGSKFFCFLAFLLWISLRSLFVMVIAHFLSLASLVIGTARRELQWSSNGGSNSIWLDTYNFFIHRIEAVDFSPRHTFKN